MAVAQVESLEGAMKRKKGEESMKMQMIDVKVV